MYHRHNRSRGFTIIELSLAMTFVSILLISIALLSIQLSKLYTRGLIMKDINQAGSELSVDIRRSTTSAFSSDVKSKTYEQQGVSTLCFGDVSYVMNSPKNIENNTATLKYTTTTPATAVRFAKVKDTNSQLCSDAYPFASGSLTDQYPDAKELLASGDADERNLVIKTILLSKKDDIASGGALVTVRLTVATSTGDEITSDNTCKPPSDVASGDEYCSISEFVIVGRVGNTFRGE